MKLRVFHAADGDCLLLSSDDEMNHMLVDGGRKGPFAEHARPALAQLREAGKALDIVCVSHIDDDHISGILQLVEDEIEWRKFEFRLAGNANAQPPRTPRPPEIKQVWHNALFQLVGEELTPQVESLLATSAGLLAGSSDRGDIDLASHYENLATGERSSLELSRRISAEELAIPLNPPAAGKLMKRKASGERIQLGDIDLFLLGPSDDDLRTLHKEWQEWVEANEAAISRLHSRLLADEQSLGALQPQLIANPIGARLGEGLSNITAPNLASLMFLAEQGDQRILLTGDGASAEILRGLRHHRKMDADGNIHVTVLKVQHHGALANVTRSFVKRVTADHYVFCGNGAHENPEIEVVQALARARLDRFDTPFKFWFTSSSTTPDLPARQKKHMKTVENRVEELIAKSNGRIQAEFLSSGHFDVL